MLQFMGGRVNSKRLDSNSYTAAESLHRSRRKGSGDPRRKSCFAAEATGRKPGPTDARAKLCFSSETCSPQGDFRIELSGEEATCDAGTWVQSLVQEDPMPQSN